MKYRYILSTLLLSLIFIVSCSTESTPVYQLNTTAEPSEAGSVSPATAEVEEGESVQITASPNEHWVFESWGGDHSGSENPVDVSMSSDKSVTALFVKREYPLTTETEGEGTVTERVVQSKTTDYPHGTTVELTASPAEGWEFVEWQGDLNGNESPQQIMVQNEKSVTAVFEKPNPDFSGGLGTEISPYQVSTLEELQKINNYTDKHFVQINDIDATETENWNSGKGFKPIGDEIIKFTGSFNGQELIISNLTINRNDESNIGLFGEVSGSELEGVVLKNVNIIGNENVGAIIGSIEGNSGQDGGSISNSSVSGTITGKSKVGGLVGLNKGRIYNSSAKITVNGRSSVGGIIGQNRGEIINTNAEGEVHGSSTSINVGGLIGSNYSKVEESSADVLVNAYRNVGGLIGVHSDAYSLDSQVLKSKSYGNVNGIIEVGGLIGKSSGGRSNDDILIDLSFASGNVIGMTNVGGLIGIAEYSNITNSYSDGEVSGEEYVGGLVGHSTGKKIEQSYAINNVSGINFVGGLVGNNRTSVYKSYSSSNVEGSGGKIGGLFGRNVSEIVESYSLGNVDGNELVGGLVGELISNGSIINSYSSGDIKGNVSVGGIVGLMKDDSMIEFIFSNGLINGESEVGGLVGTNGASMATGYWDVDKSELSEGVGRGSSDGATGLNTSEMQSSSAQENMPELDWTNVWMTTDGYPILRWQEE